MAVKGIIYKIHSKSCKEVYVGSTYQKYLSARWASHKHKYKEYLGGRYNYVSSFEIIKYGDAEIQVLETIYFEDRKELFQREAFYQNTLENICNKTIAGGKKMFVKEYNDLESNLHFDI